MKLDAVVPWGRTLAEYQAMFNLSDASLSAWSNVRILGCGDGPASFNAEMTQRGFEVTSIDPIYEFTAIQIRQRVEDTYATIVNQLQQNLGGYVWREFRNPEALGQARLGAMESFLQDYPEGQLAGRYQCQALPKLAFRDQEFGLCLCSHLLFLYSEQLSLEFHLAAISELLRVAREVRIFPLVQLNGKVSPYVESVIENFSERGFSVNIETVTYEFQKGGNQMLRIGI
ncbi:MAG: SAM-dependent methyltransferase [Pseudanabaenaceae cyanobacterium]